MRLYRVGLFTDVYFPNPNGVTTSVYLLLRELRRMGHEGLGPGPSPPRGARERGGRGAGALGGLPLLRGAADRPALGPLPAHGV